MTTTTTAPAETNEPQPDGLRLLKFGTATCTIGAQAYRLRRATVPELFTLWHAYDELQEQHGVSANARLDEAERYSEQLVEYEAALRAYEEATAARAEAGNKGRGPSKPARPVAPSASALSLRNMQAHVAWMRRVFEMLSDPALPEDAPIPAWFTSVTLPAQLIEHWRDCPLDRSDLPAAQ